MEYGFFCATRPVTTRGCRPWKAHGDEAFEYEVLEKCDEDVSPLLRRDLFSERH
jgi:hypothetical protein